MSSVFSLREDLIFWWRSWPSTQQGIFLQTTSDLVVRFKKGLLAVLVKQEDKENDREEEEEGDGREGEYKSGRG